MEGQYSLQHRKTGGVWLECWEHLYSLCVWVCVCVGVCVCVFLKCRLSEISLGIEYGGAVKLMSGQRAHAVILCTVCLQKPRLLCVIRCAVIDSPTVFVSVCVLLCVCVCVFVGVGVCFCVCLCVCACAWVCLCLYACILIPLPRLFPPDFLQVQC